MRKQHTSQALALRFKRWSRKGYAAFISIQRAVTIGQLTATIAERFQTKQESAHRTLMLINSDSKEEEETDHGGVVNESYAVNASLELLLTAIHTQAIKQPATSVYLSYKYISQQEERKCTVQCSTLPLFLFNNASRVNLKHNNISKI